MDAITLLINDIPVALQDKKSVVEQMKTDDLLLVDYVCRAVRCQRIPFCSVEDLPTMTISRLSESTIASIPGPSSVDSTEAVKHAYLKAQDQDSSNIQPSEKTPQSTSQQKKEIWSSKGRPNEDDKEATYQMLQLRASDKFVKRFNDKSSVKLELWKEIACVLTEFGFNVDVRSCRQKFSNLYTKYIKFKQHVKTTGEERREPPEFYNILDQILGGKDKVNLQHVSDTLGSVEASEEENILTETEFDENESEAHHQSEGKRKNQTQVPSTSRNSAISNEDKGKSIAKKHTTRKSDILNTITANQNEQRQQQQSQFTEIIHILTEQSKLLKQQNSQREEFLTVMKVFLKPQKKRKRRPSETESD